MTHEEIEKKLRIRLAEIDNTYGSDGRIEARLLHTQEIVKALVWAIGRLLDGHYGQEGKP